MPPNMTKVFNYWGMHDKVDSIGVVTERIVMSRFGVLARHALLGHEMLEEAGGEFIALYHSQLRAMLLETARELGAEARSNAEVVEIAEDCRSLRLASGEVLQADVIIGADGSRGTCRQLVHPQDPEKGTGIMLFNSVIPVDRILADPELSTLIQQDQVSQWAWFGHERASVCFPIGPSKDLAWYFFAPDEGVQEGWNDVLSPEEFAPYVSEAEPRLQKLARLARPARSRMMEREFPEEWVHNTGRLVLVGSAAHPFPPGIIYGPSMSLEDASVLAKLFSHLRDEEQIPSFLYAFQNLREERCQKNRSLDINNVRYMMEPEGEGTERRDTLMRAKHDQGRNVLTGDDEDSNVAQWDHNRELFGYDAEDEADNWWVQWGLLQERAKAAHSEGDTHLEMFSLDVSERISSS
ncbi:hypothetical protein B0F90DRAFT_1397850 [Multifurca ochricompacta]|uniref:FAD-binding domain-containing protein n=1 Tax=Multifurca ochricompacta TaxID=376703 RepID=A0AAD4LWN9_9AGAM|nr:hypothetical protein B0F90DRAFT_1397850 [Multifurca ochricompacta]